MNDSFTNDQLVGYLKQDVNELQTKLTYVGNSCCNTALIQVDKSLYDLGYSVERITRWFEGLRNRVDDEYKEKL